MYSSIASTLQEARGRLHCYSARQRADNNGEQGIYLSEIHKKGDAWMNDNSIQFPDQLDTLTAELQDLEVDTFEIEDLADLEQNTPSLPACYCNSCSGPACA